jgi:ketosteroid isomerase-like protein
MEVMRIKGVLFFLFFMTIILLFLSAQASDPSRITGTGADARNPIKVKPLIAKEEEVRQFFANFIDRYTRKDIDAFLSFFSSKAVHNQKDGFEEIRKIYANFFNQSRGLQYHIEDAKIEIYENAVEVKARYELDQVLKKGGKKKVWRGHIRWVLDKEDGALKILSLDYQQTDLPLREDEARGR